MTRTRQYRRIGAGFLAPAIVSVALLTTGCDVTNPGTILDKDLNDQLVLDALVTGMSRDHATMMDGIAFDMARGSDEMTGGGSYFETGLLRRGILNREDQNFEWGSQHRARWVAENGLIRMDSVLGAAYEGDPRVARAFLFAGLAHRTLGETSCFAVIDGSGVLDHEVHFDSAVVRADSAVHHAQLAGASDIVTAAYGLRAQANAARGNWTAAVSDAAMVPSDFVYETLLDVNGPQSEIYDETWGRPEMSAYNTLAERLAPDPRAPWVDCRVTPRPTGCIGPNGADGQTPHFLQLKYDNVGADIPMVKGTEMRLIEAEAFLRNNDLTNALGKINAVRTFHGLGNVSPAPATINDGWVVLDHERHLTLWMEGRRWHDARRWDEEGNKTFMPAVQFVYGNPVTVYGDPNPLTPTFDKDTSVPKRAYCIPISLAECQTNPNVLGSPECAGSFVQP